MATVWVQIVMVTVRITLSVCSIVWHILPTLVTAFTFLNLKIKRIATLLLLKQLLV
jgi:hypothetical protein